MNKLHAMESFMDIFFILSIIELAKVRPFFQMQGYFQYVFSFHTPSCHLHTVMVCSGSTPTDSSSFPVALKLTYPMPLAWEQRSTDSVCLLMASHTWIDGARPTDRHTHACTHARTRTHTHTHTQTRTHARTHITLHSATDPKLLLSAQDQ